MPLLLFYAIYNSDIVKPKLKITIDGPIKDRQAENFKAWLSLRIKLLVIFIDFDISGQEMGTRAKINSSIMQIYINNNKLPIISISCLVLLSL